MELESADRHYFSRAMGDLKRAQSIVDFVQSVLVERYDLKAGDQITLDGQIVRAPASEAQ
jgi:hypothetical protein